MKLSLRQTISNDPSTLLQAKTILRDRLISLEKASSDFTYSSADTFLSFLEDTSLHEKINTLVQDKIGSGLPRYVFVVGIGGANLGTKAVYDAIVGYGDIAFDQGRRMVFLDTLDQSVTESVLLSLKPLTQKEDFVVVIVSKSGKTIETLANTEFLLSHLESQFGEVKDRVIVVSKADSPLFKEALSKGISTFPIPEALSDRFGAFSPTTLIPLACFGFLISDFISGGKDTLKQLLYPDKNIAVETATALFSFYKKDFHIYDLFFFFSGLETLGKWQRQLVAESIGKNTNLSGETIRPPFTPTVSVGTTDLHSMLQLTLSQPKERVTSFISVEGGIKEPIGDASALDVLPVGITSKTNQDIERTILASVQESYTKEDLPYFDIVLKDISLGSLGAYMVFAMLEVVFLGALLDVNVYDQPNVEEYKERARTMLE